jgi:signal transduction histidine kinase
MFKVENAKRRGRRVWICSILLLAQLVTVAPIILIVSADQRKSALSQRCVLLLQELDQLAVSFKELEDTAVGTANQARSVAAAWQKHQSEFRDEMGVISQSWSEVPDAHEILPKMDGVINRMAQAAATLARGNSPSTETHRLIAQFLQDDESALDELAAAQRIVRFQLLLVAGGLAEKAGYLKILVAASCLLAFGVVLVFRGFRIDSAMQRRLERSLRSSNDEVIAAMAAAREGFNARNDALINVSDALRVPLNGMIGLTTKLLETELNTEQRDCAQTSLHSALSLARVVRDIQDFAKLESARLDLELEEFRPTKLIDDTLDAFRIAAGQKGLELDGMLAARLPALARGDAGRLRQILTNLMDNAVKFTEHGRIVLKATEVSRSEGRTKLRFEIKDTGIGINEQIRDQLFEPLPLGDRSTALELGGVGLGLAISKKLIELMGGEIDVVSTPATGSTFWFTVVLEHVPANPGLQPGCAENAADEAPHQPREAVLQIASPAARTKTWLGRERRVESRYRMNYPTVLKSKAAGIALVRVLDASGFGLRVAVPFRLPVGSEVEIRIEKTRVRGLVRNCTCKKAKEFYVGIELLQSDSIDERGLADFVARRTIGRSMAAK